MTTKITFLLLITACFSRRNPNNVQSTANFISTCSSNCVCITSPCPCCQSIVDYIAQKVYSDSCTPADTSNPFPGGNPTDLDSGCIQGCICVSPINCPCCDSLLDFVNINPVLYPDYYGVRANVDSALACATRIRRRLNSDFDIDIDPYEIKYQLERGNDDVPTDGNTRCCYTGTQSICYTDATPDICIAPGDGPVTIIEFPNDEEPITPGRRILGRRDRDRDDENDQTYTVLGEANSLQQAAALIAEEASLTTAEVLRRLGSTPPARSQVALSRFADGNTQTFGAPCCCYDPIAMVCICCDCGDPFCCPGSYPLTLAQPDLPGQNEP